MKKMLILLNHQIDDVQVKAKEISDLVAEMTKLSEVL